MLMGGTAQELAKGYLMLQNYHKKKLPSHIMEELVGLDIECD